MSQFIQGYTPNKKVVTDTDHTDTAWRAVATDGTAYTTLALLVAAGKTPFPGLDPGVTLATLLARSIAPAGPSDGSAFYIQFNSATQPGSDNAAHFVSASGQTITFQGPFNNVWVRKTVAADNVVLEGAY